VDRRSLIAATIVAAVGVAALWVLGASTELCGIDGPETASTHVDFVLLPPGARRCVTELQDGTARSELLLPWNEWLGILVIAAAAGVMERLSRRTRGFVGSVWAAVWTLLGVMVAAFYGVAALVFVLVAALGLVLSRASLRARTSRRHAG
jgi:hypothetical protein